MRIVSKVIFSLVSCFYVSMVSAQEDENVEPCTSSFMERSERVSSLAQTKLVTRSGQVQTMIQFFNQNTMSGFTEHGVLDLDGDGKKELVITNYTGGAHCCDEVYLFTSIGKDRYKYVSKLFAGDVCINEENIFIYRFYQQLGYFFTCFACVYEDTTDTAPIPVRGIRMQFKSGKLAVVPGDKELRSIINDNLAKLCEQPYMQLTDHDLMDEGLRKEVAFNLAVFHFSFGKNLLETQKLYNKYYKYPDAKEVWTQFIKHLQDIRRKSGL